MVLYTIMVKESESSQATQRSWLRHHKKLEYELLFNIQNFYTKYQIPSYEKAILSFLKEVERTGLKFKQVSDIDTKLNYFKNYCFSIGISDLDAINRNHANTYIVRRSQTKLAPATLNMEFRFIKRFFNHCIMMKWINRNPFWGIKYIKDRRNIKRYFFSDDDLSVIIGITDKCHDIYTFLLNIGIRSTDAFTLKPKHIQDNYLVKQMNKTGDWLNIPLPATAQQILEKRISGEFIFDELQTSFQRSIKTTERYANWVRQEKLER